MGATPEQRLNDSVVWVVGQQVDCFDCSSGGSNTWEFQGVFATEHAAIVACKTNMYFIFPATIGEELPEEPIDIPGAYFPISEPTGGV